MARIKIDLPEHFLYSTEMDVRVTDLNYGRHVGNDTVLGLLHEARMRLFAHWGYHNELDGIEGFGVIVADAALVYKAETFYGDRMLIEIAAADENKYGWDFVYRITRVGDGQELARAKTGMVCFDYAARKIALLPEGLKARLRPAAD